MDAVKCEAFLTAVDLGSMTAAAGALGYTQSGITRMIRSLENELGFPLLLRGKQGVSPTENGRLMLPAFRNITRAHHNAEQMGADIREVASGALSIGSYYSISALWMPSILKQFEELYPGVKVRLREGGNLEMKRWLNEKSVDCCFCAEPSPGTICDWLPIFQDEIVVWLPKSHPKAGADSFPIRDLEKEPFIYTSPNHDTDQDRLLSAEHLNPNVCYSTEDGFSTYNMVAAGLGISFNQKLISQKWSGDVAELPLSPRRYISMGIAVSVLNELSPAAKKFIQCAYQSLDCTAPSTTHCPCPFT